MSKRLRREKSAKKTAKKSVKKTVKTAATLKRKSSPSKSRQTKPLQTKSLQTKSLQTKSPGRQRRAGEKAKMSSEPTASKGNSPSAAAPAAAAAERPAAQIRYLDRADMEETFAELHQRSDFRRPDAAHRVRRHPLRRNEGQCADHRPALSGLPLGAAARRGGRSDQPHAADCGSPDAGRRGAAGAAPRSAESRLTPASMPGGI